MTIAKRLGIGFAIVLTFLLIVSVAGVTGLSRTAGSFDAYRDYAVENTDLSRVLEEFILLRIEAKNYNLEGDEVYLARFEELHKEILVEIEHSLQNASHEEVISQLQEIKSSLDDYNAAFVDISVAYKKQVQLQREVLDVNGLNMRKEIDRVQSYVVRQRDAEGIRLTGTLQQHLLLGRLHAAKYLQKNMESDIQRVREELVEGFSAVYSALLPRIGNSTYRAILKDINAQKEAYTEAFSQVIVHTSERLHIIENRLDPTGSALTTKISDLQHSIAGLQGKHGNSLQSNVLVITWTVVIIALLAIGLTVVLLFVLTGQILKPLGAEPEDLAGVAEGISQGDMTIEFDSKRMSGVYFAMKTMSDRLGDVVSRIREIALQVASATTQIASGNQDLSKRTEQQAASLEETSASIEEMTASIKNNSDSAQQASQLSKIMDTKAADGMDKVNTVVHSMEEIDSSSKRIADIIAVMNDLAFQTNLLALNASIEAARAGEQGRGFAVVAVEVRKLAQRSDEAAKEIAELIRDSNSKVNNGVDYAKQAGTALEEINQSVKSVNQLIEEINASSQEQLSNVEELNKTIFQLNENTQQNASLVEESAASTEELSGQAQELSESLSYFTVDSNSQQPKAIAHKSATGIREVKSSPAPKPKPGPAKSEYKTEGKEIKADQDAIDGFEEF